MAKRSRRERKPETEKRQQLTDAPQTTPVAPVEAAAPQPAPVAAPVESAPPLVRSKTINFADEYFYVYTDLRSVSIIAVIMFALMFGLGFLI